MRARRHRNSYWLWMLAAVTLVLPAQPVIVASASGTAAAKAIAARAAAPVVTTPNVTLQVRSARDSLAYSATSNPTAAQKLDPIPDLRTKPGSANFLKPNAPKDYKWLLNLDNTGNPQGGADSALCHPSTNPTYPAGCTWPSIKYATASPALSEGTWADWNNLLALPAYATDGVGVVSGLPDSCDASTGNPVPHAPGAGPAAGTVACKFLVSVSADGYQLGGAHFSVPMPVPGVVDVFMNPFPVPLGTMRLAVFNDSHPTNGQFDHLSETGLEGFLGVVFDVDGILQADFYGNPLCTVYKTDSSGQIILDSYGHPTRLPAADPAPVTPAGYHNPSVPGRCLSDSNGDITIPNLAPNHYSARVTPPDFNPKALQPDTTAYHWLQTTTLEGNHDHDVWVMPNDTGMDTELVVGGESVPFVDFGFVPVTPQPTTWACPVTGVVGQTSGCGQIKGQLYGATSYIPGVNGVVAGATAGTAGLKLDRPLDRGWVALSNLNVSAGDAETMVATIPTDKNGYFNFTNVPDGDYSATIFDEPQEYILDSFSVTISHGQVVDMGTVPLLGWFSHIFGHVFIDLNGNGRQDPGEPGLFHAFVQNLNRTNNTMVGGIATAYTDNNGFYDFKEAYPLGMMSINQFFNTRYKTTGITYQTCNDPKEHTVVAPMVDVSYLPIISQCGRLDWGVTPYNPSANGDNGGIVATMLYDQTRQKYNARQAQSGDFQTGIPGFRFEQYTPIKAGPLDPTSYVDATGNVILLVDPMSGYKLVDGRVDPQHAGQYQTKEATTPPDGLDCSSITAGYVPGVTPLCYVSENNGPPAKCYPKDANGAPQGYDPANPRSFDFVMFGGACVESAASGMQIGLGTDGKHAVQTVDGNYGLGNGSTIPAMNLGDTLVRAVVPVDTVLGSLCPAITGANKLPPGCDAAQVGFPRKLYTYTSEEDVNLFSGAQFVPQGANMASLPWPPKANYFASKFAPTSVTSTVLTDAQQQWVPGAFVGDQVKMGGATATVTANTATTLTFAKWSIAGAPVAGPYTVRGSEIIPGNYDENQFTYAPGIDPICAGLTHTVQVTNPDLLANGGSPLEGQTRHSCDMKLLNVQAGQSIAPNFHVRTAVDIALPTHFAGLIIDDVSVDTNRKSIGIGEVHGIPGAPIGLYDWTGRRVGNVTSDYNGIYEILMPSESLNNCPVPAGSCPNVYRFVGNDPGQPAAPNLNYNPNYKTISANFEAWPNMLVPADNAPSRVITNINAPGLQFTSTSPCGIKDVEPQLYSVGPDPFTSSASTTITIKGANFGTAGHVLFSPANGDTPVRLRTVGAWGDNQVQVLIGRDEVGGTGPGMLTVYNDTAVDPTTGKASHSTSGLTFHILGGGYNPHIIKVGPGKEQTVAGQLVGIDPFLVDSAGKLVHPFPIQEALDLAAQRWQDFGVSHVDSTHTVSQVANMADERYMVVVYPKWSTNPDLNTAFVPVGTYFENLIVHSPVKLQGVGPGGNYADPATGSAVAVQGSIIDGRYFNLVTANVDLAPTPNPATDSTEPAILHWVNLLASIENSAHGTGLLPASPLTPNSPPWTGQQSPIGEGAVITVVGTKGTYPSGFKAAVDGFTISGGDQRDFPGNINGLGGGHTGHGNEGPVIAGADAVGAATAQGGAIYLNGGTDNFQITNNLVRQNSGSYGTIRLGTNLHGSAQATGGGSHNWNTAISHNQIAFNGGNNLAGAVGLFSDSNNYSVDNNTFCMNAALEYGGAVSHFGFSPNGHISYNKMLLNSSVDEGGAIMVASEPAYRIVGGDQVPDPAGVSEGSGAVSIDHNYMGINIAQDDGGAIRLMGTTGKGNAALPARPNGLSPITITNNILTNNISAHEGGAISLNDAPVVDIVNNTISGNLTTATSVTSNGAPAPAGVASGSNSAGLTTLLNTTYAGQAPEWMQTGLTAGPDPRRVWPAYSSPLIENDIFFDNRAGSWTPNGVAQLGLPTDLSAINRWDVGSVDGGASLRVRYSLVYSSPTAQPQTWADDGHNKVLDIATGPVPGFISSYNACSNYPPAPTESGCLMIQIQQLRTYFRFRPAAIVSVDLPDNAFGNYHLQNVGSPAHAMGANPQDLTTDALANDIDNNARPNAPTLVTAGAHEVTTAVPVVAPVVRPVVPPGVAPIAAAVVTPAGANPPLVNLAAVNVVPAIPPLGLPGGNATPRVSFPAPVTVRLAPISGPQSRGGASSSAALGPAAGAGLGTALVGILAFESLPEHQGETGLAGLVGLSLLLAAFQFGRVVLGRRRKTVQVNSDEQNIEGGEQL